ncbi:caspase family protein [Candidatus Woesearchaeota archaeon]|nr:caspase family protein [Candidatus Woesearchaeota archaeon]
MPQAQIPQTYSESAFGKRQALLVQQDPSFEDSAFIVGRVLRQRGYNLTQIGPGNCTKENVLASIDGLAASSEPDTKTLFYYTGHGFSEHRLTTIVDSRSRGFRPQDLFQALGLLRGRKAVFLDACLSGEFVDYLATNAGELIRNYVVLAATSKDGLSVTTKWETPNIPQDSVLNGKSISHLAHWLFMQHAERGYVDLNTCPIDERKYRVPPEADALAQGLPWKIILEIQRTSDVQFDL